MKFVTIILSVFILGLAFTPCSDAYNSDHQEEITETDKHDHSENKDDSCHSICVCACCGVSFTYESVRQFETDITNVIISKDDFTYQVAYTFYLLSGIWQPPKYIS